MLQAAAPCLANFHRDGMISDIRRLFMKLFAVVIGVGAAGVVIAYLLGEEILGLVYGKTFSAYGDVLVWIMTAASVMYISQLFGMLLTIARSFRFQILANIAGIVVMVVTCMLLVPQSGLTGAAQAFLVGALATCTVNVVSACLAVPFMGLPGIRYNNMSNGTEVKMPSPD